MLKFQLNQLKTHLFAGWPPTGFIKNAAYLMFAMLAMAVATEAAAVNLLTNPGFETGDKTGWSGTATVASGNANTGIYALAISGDPSKYRNSAQSVAVVSGNTYRFEGLVMVTGRTTGNYRFQIRWYNSSGVEFNSARQNFGITNGNTAYAYSAIEVTAPTGAASVKIQLRADKADGTGYFDDISITDLT